jgi:hypothetical protein
MNQHAKNVFLTKELSRFTISTMICPMEKSPTCWWVYLPSSASVSSNVQSAQHNCSREGFVAKMESNDEHLVHIAANIFWLVPTAGTSFIIMDAMTLAGTAKDVTRASTFQNKTKVVLMSL